MMIRSGIKTVARVLIGTLLWSVACPALLPWAPKTAVAAQPIKPETRELTEFRTAHSKRFENPDGTVTDKISLGPIHYQEKATKKWVEIDTKLVPTGRPDFAYKTKAGRLQAELAKDPSGPEMLRVTLDEDQEFRLKPVGLSRGAVSVKDSQATYAEVRPDADVTWKFDAVKVLGEMTLRSEQAAREVWRYKLWTNKLSAQAEDDGSVGLYDRQGKLAFRIPVPEAHDANGTTIPGAVTLRKVEGETFLEFRLDRDARAALASSDPMAVATATYSYPVSFPVTIWSTYDEQVASRDTIIAKSTPDTNYYYYDHFRIGNDADLGVSEGLIWFPMPSVPADKYVLNANLYLEASSLPSSGLPAKVDVFEVNSGWTSSTVTWNTRPSVGAASESTTMIDATGWWSWNVTDSVYNWVHRGVPNNGLLLKQSDETKDAIRFWSSDWPISSSWPIMEITYGDEVNALGLESFWTYAGNMNVANSNLVLSTTDAAIPSRGMTATVTRTYNSRSTYSGSFGYGWTSELDEKLIVNADNASQIAWVQPDGTVHYFEKPTGGTDYFGPPGLFMKIRLDDKEAQTGAHYILSPLSGFPETRFDANGRILSITDIDGNEIKFTWNTANRQIIDPAGRSITLAVDDQGRVTQMTDQANKVTTYTYTAAGDLASVTYSGASVSYGWDVNHNLREITSPEGRKSCFAYTTTDRLLSSNLVNMIPNSSFEVDSDANGVPDLWSINSNGEAYIDPAPVPAPAAKFDDGLYKINLKAPNSSSGAWGVYVSEPLILDRTKAYTLSGWVQAKQSSGSQKAVLSVLGYDPSGYYVGEYARAESTGMVTDWTQLKQTLDPNELPSTVATIRVKIAASNTGGTGSSYFDGVQLESGGVATEFAAPTTYTRDPIPGNRFTALYDGKGNKVKWSYNAWGNARATTADPGGPLETAVTDNWLTQYLSNQTTNPTGGIVTREFDANGNLVSSKTGISSDLAAYGEETLTYNEKNLLFTYRSAEAPSATEWSYTDQQEATLKTPTGVASGAQYVDRLDCKGCVRGQTPSMSTAPNLLTNFHFERWTGSTPDGWTVSDPAAVSATSGTDPVHVGAKALKIVPTRLTSVTQAVSGAKPDTYYTLSLYVRSGSTAQTALAEGWLQFFSGSTQVGTTQFTNRESVSDQWTRVMVTAKAPAGTDRMVVGLSTSYSGPVDAVFVDSVQLEEAPYMSAFNWVENSGFEQGINAIPDRWVSFGDGTWSKTEGIHGNTGMKLTGATVSDGNKWSGLWTPSSELVKYDRSKPLTLTAFVKTDQFSNGTVYVKLKWFDASKVVLPTENDVLSDSKLTGTNGWTRIFVEVPAEQAPTSAVYVQPVVMVGLDSDASGWSVTFDGVRLEEGRTATSFTYGSAGPAKNNWVTKVTNARDESVTYQYDAAGLGLVTQVTTSSVGGQAVTKDYTWDDFGRLKTASMPNGLVLNYEYDKDGLLTSATRTGDGQTAGSSFRYDGLGLLQEIISPIGSTKYAYDEAGRLTSTTDPALTTSAFTYDALSRVTSKAVAGGPTYSYGYNQAGALTSVTMGGTTWSWQYDELNRLSKAVNPNGNGEVSYTYDRDGRLKEQKISLQGFAPTITMEYDKQTSQLVRANRDGKEAMRFSYNEHGQVVKEVVDDGNGTALFYSVFEYDELGRLLQRVNRKPDGTHLSTYGYTYDKQGNRATETIATGTDAPVTRTFRYDSVSQLLEDDTASYTYSARGNRLTRTTGGTTTNYCYNDKDQLFHVYDGEASTCPTESAGNIRYDANGNMIYKKLTENEWWDYSYDKENRLIQVQKNGALVATYTYDGQGRRASKTASGKTTSYFYDGTSSRVLYEMQGSVITAWNHWVGDQLVSQQRGGQVRYMEYNAHGDIVAILDGAGNIVESYQYDVWGKPVNQVATDKNPYRYAGYRWDEETGLYFLNARYYDPDLGRFMTADTAPESENAYSYAANNPVAFVDPSGHFLWFAVGMGIGIVGGAIYGAYTSYKETGSVDWGEVAQDAAIGGMIGASGGLVLAEAAVYTGVGMTYAGMSSGVAVTSAGMAGLGLAGAPSARAGGGSSGSAKGAGRRINLQLFAGSNIDEVIEDTVSAARGSASTPIRMTSQYTLSETEALDMGLRFLGPGYTEIGSRPNSGVFQNGNRIFRLDNDSLLGTHRPGVPHVHLEILAENGRNRLVNNHIRIWRDLP